MESFMISVDLKSFFNDFRAKSVVFVDTTVMKTVKHVERHIKTLFDIEADTYIFSNNDFVPHAEDSRVLKMLPNIRLETWSSSCCDEYKNDSEYQNGCEKDQDFVPTSKKKRKKDEPPVDKDEISERLSIKKKHKKIQVDNESCNYESPATQHGIPDDHSAHSTDKPSSQSGKVKKIANSEQAHCPSKPSTSDFERTGKSKQDGTPNKVFYDALCGKALEAIRSRWNTEKSGMDVRTNTCETPGDKVESDLDVNIDGTSKRRKRIRKRKKSAKPEITNTAQDAVAVPQTKLSTLSRRSESSTCNSKHTYFSEKEEDDVETPKTLEEDKIDTEDINESTLLECPEKAVHEEVRNESTTSDNPSKALQSTTSENPSENTNSSALLTTSLPSVEKITKSKVYSAQVSRGLGKLLSLVRNETPPVFERKRAMRTEQTSPRPEVDVPKDKMSSNAPSSVRYPSDEQVSHAETVSLSTFLSPIKRILTPLKTIPDENTKISFKMLKMSASYCPEVSNAIVAVVEGVNQETQDLTLKIISGAEECEKPKGKFDLLDPETTEEESGVDKITLNWQEIIQPTLYQ